jgi:protein-tyrosine phosphatase
MGLISFLKEFFSTPVRYRSRPDGLRILDVPSGENVRELGGYRALGGMTRSNRYVRSGSTDYLLERDMRALEHHGVTHVLDLRGNFERPAQTCHFAHRAGVRWVNVPLFGYDISDPKLRHSSHDEFEDYLVESYLTMLANHTAIRNIIEFLANVPEGQCALFHCAAGMDRTGITAMLLLGAVGVGRTQIICDYAYSFGTIAEVDRAAIDPDYDGESTWNSIKSRMDTMATVYDTLVSGYGSVYEYLLACGVSAETLETLRGRFVEPASAPDTVAEA